MRFKFSRILITLILIASFLLSVIQAAACDINISDDISQVTAETSVMNECKPGYYKTKLKINMRNAPSLEGKYLSYVSAGRVLNITAVSTDADGYYWGHTTYNSVNGMYSGYVRLDNCEKYILPPMTTDDLNGEEKVDWTVIDISQWQNADTIDWQQMKAAGVKGVIIRIGGRYYGSPNGALYNDIAFTDHYINARAAGMHIGCYFFSHALNAEQAKAEAEYTLKLIKEYNASFDMPVFIDIEEGEGIAPDYYNADQASGKPKSVCTEVCNAFCSVIEKAGFYSGIYCNLNFTNTLIDASAFNNRGAWIAQYNVTCDYTGRVDMWQYTKSGILGGYPYYLDVNHCYLNYPKYISELGQRHEEETTEDIPEEPPKPKRIEKTVVISEPTCNKNGKSEFYINDVLFATLITEKKHGEAMECILQDETEVKFGDILKAEILDSAMKSDSPYFEKSLEELQEKGGVTVSYCPDCLKVLALNYYYAPSGCEHKNPVTTEDSPATCTEDGTATTKCSGCGIILNESIIPMGHTPGEPELITEESEKPYITVTCTTCNELLTKRTLETGDIDHDGVVTVNDARIILRIAIDLEKGNEESVKLADTDEDGKLTVADARTALRKAIKLE